MFRSTRVWNLYIDLEESLGTVVTTKAAYERALEVCERGKRWAEATFNKAFLQFRLHKFCGALHKYFVFYGIGQSRRSEMFRVLHGCG